MKTSALVLFACAGLLLSGGTLLCATVAWNLLRMSYYFWITDLGVELSSSIIFLAGSLLCLPTCWIATLVPHYTKSKIMNTILIGVSTVAILVLSLGMSSMSALSRSIREPAALNNSMLRAMHFDLFDPAVRSAFASMQIELKCCGVQSHSDWYQHQRSLPSACCGRVWNSKRGDTACDVPQFSGGCLWPALAELRGYVNTLSALSAALVIVMAITLFTAVYIQVTNEIEYVKFNPTTPPLLVGMARFSQPPPFPQVPQLSIINSMPPVANVI